PVGTREEVLAGKPRGKQGSPALISLVFIRSGRVHKGLAATRDDTCAATNLRITVVAAARPARRSRPRPHCYITLPPGSLSRMHIKKLEIAGFKSFVDRTVSHFDHDVIGIVGPNGCGKSNIVDAIRWCLGEQSA